MMSDKEIPQNPATEYGDLSKEKTYNGLGGWLVFLAVSLLVETAISAMTVLDSFFGLYYADSPLSFKNTFDAVSFTSSWINTLLILLIAIPATIAFFKKKRIFKKNYKLLIYVMTLTATIDLLIGIWAYTVGYHDKIYALNVVIPDFIRPIFWACIIFPYLNQSKRVRDTFTGE